MIRNVNKWLQVINSLLVVAAKSSTVAIKKANGTIYNCVVGNIWQKSNGKQFFIIVKIIKHWFSEQTLRIVIESAKDFPSTKMVWYPNLKITKTQISFKIWFFILHYLPAFFVDIGLYFMGSKIRLVNIYSKIYKQMQLLTIFTQNSWKFSEKNMQNLHSLMTPEDHENFYCVLKKEDGSDEQIKSAVDGIRKYFFKENEKDLVEARIKYKKLKVLRIVLLLIIFSIMSFLILNKMQLL